MTELPYVVLDVFTDTPLQGNALAVFPDGGGLDTAVMQRAARELNLSETVFVTGDAGAGSAVRIFTPTAEMPFAGHPILGTAWALAAESTADTIELHPPAGPVPVRITRGPDGAPAHGEMDQPLPVIEEFPAADEALAALGCGPTALPLTAYRNGPAHVFAVVEDPAVVRGLEPDIGRLARLGPFGFSCAAIDGDRVRTRMFGPGLGVAEDPATGSAAGPLAAHLARHGRVGFGTPVEITQGEEIGRPSTLFATVDGTPERIERVRVGGTAVIVARGHYRLV